MAQSNDMMDDTLAVLSMVNKLCSSFVDTEKFNPKEDQGIVQTLIWLLEIFCKVASYEKSGMGPEEIAEKSGEVFMNIMAGFEHTISQPADKFKFMTAQIYIEVFIGMQMTGEQLKNAIESSKAKL